MPMKRHLYPPDWESTSKRIRHERAGGKCECTGECGLNHSRFWHEGDALRVTERCDAPNGQIIIRSPSQPWIWETEPGPIADSSPDAKPIKVVLTVAHLNHDASDNRDENMKAMCQLCHLRLDRDQHAAGARATRRGRRAVRDLFDS